MENLISPRLDEEKFWQVEIVTYRRNKKKFGTQAENAKNPL